MKYAEIINQIANHIPNEPSRIKREMLRETAHKLKDASRHAPMATDNYNRQIIIHALRLMGVEA